MNASPPLFRFLTFCSGLFAASPAWATTISSYACTRQAANSMRYDCHVELSGSDVVKVGYREAGTGGAWTWSKPKSGSSLDFTLYNFRAGTNYSFRVQVLGSVYATGALTPAPELPTNLGALNLTVTLRASATTTAKYVLFDTQDCQGDGSYLVALDTTDGHIAWYLDIPAETGGTALHGWRYTEDGNILGIVDRKSLYEWDFAGAVIDQVTYDNCDGTDGTDVGPCPHHDAFKLAGGSETLTLTASEDLTTDPTTTTDFATCGAYDGFVDDGFDVSVGGAVVDQYSLETDFGFDPDVDAGPRPTPCAEAGFWNGPWFYQPMLDWTHANSIYVNKPGPTAPEFVTLSVRMWSEVIFYNATSGTELWRLNGAESATRGDFDIVNDASVSGPENFGGQHFVTEEEGNLQMFDNRSWLSSDIEARAIRLDIAPGSGSTRGTATIVKSWVLRNADLTSLDCTDSVGSAVTVAGTALQNVLVDCGPENVIQELDEGDGLRTLEPLLDIRLVDNVGPAFDTCKSPVAEAGGVGNWYRAWPLLKLGDF